MHIHTHIYTGMHVCTIYYRIYVVDICDLNCQQSTSLRGYGTIALISHTSKAMLKILQKRLQQCMNWEIQDVQAGFRKCRGTRYQTWVSYIAGRFFTYWATLDLSQKAKKWHPLDHRKIKRIPEKASTSASLTTLKPLTLWITANCGKFLKGQEYQNTLPVSWETCMQVKKR